MIVDWKDPSLMKQLLGLNNTPHTNGYRMKVQQRRTPLKYHEIYALAYKDLGRERPSNVSAEETRGRCLTPIVLIPKKPR